MIILAKVKDEYDKDTIIDKWLLRTAERNLKTFASFPKLIQFTLEGEWQPAFESMRSSGDFVYVNMETQMEPAVVKSLDESDYPVSPLKWGLDRMSKRKVTSYNGEFSSSNYGENVDIYIIDGGVNYGHPEFSNVASDGGPRARSINYNSIATDPWYLDLAGTDNAQDAAGGSSHGTGVAMCAAGKEIGVAHNATIISVRVELTSSQITSAMDSVIQHHKLKPNRRHSVLNLSFGSTFAGAPYGLNGTQALMVYDASLASAYIDDLVDAAITAGVTTTVSAGNGPAKFISQTHPAMGWAGIHAAGSIPGFGSRAVQTRVFRGPNNPATSLTANGDAKWSDYDGGAVGDKAGYVLVNDVWTPHSVGFATGGASFINHSWGGLSNSFDLASHDVLVKSGIYANGPYSIASNSYVDVYFTPLDPVLYDLGFRSQAIDGSVWVKLNPYAGPTCAIWRRVAGAWVNSGNTTHIGPNMGGLNVEVTGLGSTISATSEVIFVGACSADDYVSSFSNYGGRVDLYAPGQGLTFPDLYATTSVDMSASAGGAGTSYSAPFVAGLAAIYLNDRTQPGTNGVVSAGSDPGSVRAHLINNASTGLKNTTSFKTYDLMYLNNSRANFGLGGNLFHPFEGEDWVKNAVTGTTTGRFISWTGLTAANFDSSNDLKDYVASGATHKIARLLSAIPAGAVFTDYYSEGILGYHPMSGKYEYGSGIWDFTKASIEEFDYAALDATVHDRIAFNSFVDKTVVPFQSDVTALTFANANNNQVFLQAGSHSWDGEQIGKQVYTLTSGSLPTGVTLNPDGTFNSNIAAGATSTPVPFSVSVTDSLGSTLTANYTGALSPYHYGLRIFDGAGNITFDADTRGHNLISTYDVTGTGVFTESIDISGLSELSNASISTTTQLIGHSTYDAWDNITFPICPIIEKRHYIDHVTETIESRIDISYSLQSLESCFASSAGTAWGTYKNGLTIRVYVWAVNQVNVNYGVESIGTLK